MCAGVGGPVAGWAAGGACVPGLGRGSYARARTGSAGRYRRGGVGPGEYRIRGGAGASVSRPSSPAEISAYWISAPASVIVRAGQISNPAPLSIWHLDLASLTASAHQALSASAVRAKRGSISGLVTGNGRPLRGVCALAVPLSAGPEAIARTGKTGRYRITRLRPGRYYVAFFAGLGPCTNKGNWLVQLYRGVNSLFVTRKVKAVRVRAGKDTGGIDGHLKKGGEISGTVRAKSGKALPG